MTTKRKNKTDISVVTSEAIDNGDGWNFDGLYYDVYKKRSSSTKYNDAFNVISPRDVSSKQATLERTADKNEGAGNHGESLQNKLLLPPGNDNATSAADSAQTTQEKYVVAQQAAIRKISALYTTAIIKQNPESLTAGIKTNTELLQEIPDVVRIRLSNINGERKADTDPWFGAVTNTERDMLRKVTCVQTTLKTLVPRLRRAEMSLNREWNEMYGEFIELLQKCGFFQSYFIEFDDVQMGSTHRLFATDRPITMELAEAMCLSPTLANAMLERESAKERPVETNRNYQMDAPSDSEWMAAHKIFNERIKQEASRTGSTDLKSTAANISLDTRLESGLLHVVNLRAQTAYLRLASKHQERQRTAHATATVLDIGSQPRFACLVINLNLEKYRISAANLPKTLHNAKHTKPVMYKEITRTDTIIIKNFFFLPAQQLANKLND
jgi:hypothetical protein